MNAARDERKSLSRVPPRSLTVLALAFVGLTASFMFTLIVPLQADLPAVLGESREDTAWVVTITMLVSATITPIVGRLGDMFGKRRIVLILVGILILGSVIAALSTGIIGIIIGRGMQGGGMGVIPLGIAIMRDVLPPEKLGTAVALMSATMGIGGSLGLPLAAYIAETADFHMLFWLAAGLGVISLLLVWRLVPEDVLRFPGRVDFIGAIGLAAGMTGILLMLSRGAGWGWSSALTLGCGIGGIVIMLLWGWYQMRAKEPLLNLRIVARRSVLFTNIAALCMGFALFSSNVTFPQMLELPVETGSGFGLSMLGAAWVVMPSGITMLLIAPISGWLERTIGPRIMAIIGTSFIMISYLFVLVFSSEIWHILMANLLIGVGIGFSFAAMPIIIMRSVPTQETGASNGVNSLFRNVGSATGSAVMGGVLAAVSTTYEGAIVPTRAAFDICFWLAIVVAAAAVMLTVMIPKRITLDPHPSIPESRL